MCGEICDVTRIGGHTSSGAFESNH